MKRLVVPVLVSGLIACATPQVKPVETVESETARVAPAQTQVTTENAGSGEVDLDAIQPEVIELGIEGSSTSPITVDVAVEESPPPSTIVVEEGEAREEETPKVDPKKNPKKDTKKKPAEEPTGVQIDAGDAPQESEE